MGGTWLAAVLAALALGVPLGTPDGGVPGAPVAARAEAAFDEVLTPIEVSGEPIGEDPSPRAVTRAVDPVLDRVPGPVPALVVDTTTGTTLYANDGAQPAIPASTMKLVTALSALASMSPGQRPRTTTWLRRSQDATPTLILVGGGDATLTSTARTVGGPGTLMHPATTKELAAQTAPALIRMGVTRVRLAYDASLFTGPAMNPDWQAAFPAAGIVAPVSALMVDGGRTAPGALSRAANPAARATAVFARQLTNAGVRVTNSSFSQRKAGSDAEHVAAVAGPTIAEQVERMLGTSDNDIAEALARLAAHAADRPASFTGAARQARSVLRAAGIDLAGVVLRDGSGLSRRNRLTPRALTELLVAVARAGNPGPQDQDSASTPGEPAAWQVSALRSGLPVAGATGSLRVRFLGSGAREGRGQVRAKTGTLTGVVTLAGYASRPDGRLLAFAFMADATGGQSMAARSGLDHASAELVGCDCGLAPEPSATP